MFSTYMYLKPILLCLKVNKGASQIQSGKPAAFQTEFVIGATG